MNAEILSQLKDVHLPQNPSWWPLAWGYFVLLAVIIIFLLLIIFFIYKKKPKWALRKRLNLELKIIEEKYLADKNTNALQNNLVILIKRVARSTQSQADLSLNTCVQKLFNKNSETTEFVELLEHDRFKKVTDISPTRLLELAKKKFKKCTL